MFKIVTETLKNAFVVSPSMPNLILFKTYPDENDTSNNNDDDANAFPSTNRTDL